MATCSEGIEGGFDSSKYYDAGHKAAVDNMREYLNQLLSEYDHPAAKEMGGFLKNKLANLEKSYE